jgi:RimJ/RimL family protein N-acetyltransferase
MFARTKRLTLRPGWPEDAPALATAIGHERVVGKLSQAPWPYGVSDAESFLALPRRPYEPNFLIFESPSDAPRLIGGIAVHGAALCHVRCSSSIWTLGDDARSDWRREPQVTPAQAGAYRSHQGCYHRE